MVVSSPTTPAAPTVSASSIRRPASPTRKIPSSVPFSAKSTAPTNLAKKMLLVLVDTPLSSREIAYMMEMESKSGAFKRTLKALVFEGLVEYTIPGKPNSRLQKYRLTAKGQQWLEENRE